MLLGKNFFWHEQKEDYYESVSVSNFWSIYYIGHESKDNTNKKISIKEYLIKLGNTCRIS